MCESRGCGTRPDAGEGVTAITIKISTTLIYIVNTSLQSKYWKMLVIHKTLLDNYLHLWPAGDPLVCSGGCCLACSGPDEGGAGAVGVVAVGIAPGVDKEVGGYAGINHSGFGLEVAFGVGGGGESG